MGIGRKNNEAQKKLCNSYKKKTVYVFLVYSP